jgi:hypothetical protein
VSVHTTDTCWPNAEPCMTKNSGTADSLSNLATVSKLCETEIFARRFHTNRLNRRQRRIELQVNLERLKQALERVSKIGSASK